MSQPTELSVIINLFNDSHKLSAALVIFTGSSISHHCNYCDMEGISYNNISFERCLVPLQRICADFGIFIF